MLEGRNASGGGLTDNEGVARIHVIVASAVDGLYRIRFKTSGVHSAETNAFSVYGITKGIYVSAYSEFVYK